jgi:hypothetical protein
MTRDLHERLCFSLFRHSCEGGKPISLSQRSDVNGKIRRRDASNKAGDRRAAASQRSYWIPACAGMTV